MPPNVLLVLTDQERHDLTAPDGPSVRTPNVDRIAGEGMRFERAYTPIGICSSARASLLSGLYPHAHGMLNNCHDPDAILRNFPEEIPTFGEVLARRGYQNSYAGKWHVGCDQTPADFGFEYLGGGDGAHAAADEDFFDHQREHGVDPESIELSDAIYHENNPDKPICATAKLPVEATRAYYIAEKTIDRLENLDADDGPFFHRTDFVGPHHPYVVPEPYASMYDPDEIEPWASFDETFEGKPRVQENYRRYRGVAGLDWDEWAEAISNYFGFMTLIDDQLGRILDAAEGIENLVVVKTADHGDFAGGHRLFNKGPMMYEATYRIPLAIRWPEVVEPGSTCDAPVSLLDLMPTFLDLADASPPEPVHGRSIRPLLAGRRPDDWPDAAFAQYHGDEYGLYSQRMLRTERYKYVYNVPDVDELYDLREDPHELDNRIDDPQYESVRAALRERLVARMDSTGDPNAVWARRALLGGRSSDDGEAEDVLRELPDDTLGDAKTGDT